MTRCYVGAKSFGADADVDYVGRRLKNRLGLPFIDFGGKKRAKKVGKSDDSSVFRKLTDLLVDQLEIPIIVEAIHDPEAVHDPGPAMDDSTLR